ncbi:MAG: transcription initiation protein [Bacteroidetes bacterium]|nr:transcription initiation protein [Bacteroidota bacterium]
MSDFLLVFRMNPPATQAPPSPEQMQENMKKWMDWIGGITAQNKLVNGGQRLHMEGKVVRANNVVTDGPYVETKEAVGGFTIVRADSLEEATELANGCPILNAPGGSVEVRRIWPIE